MRIRRRVAFKRTTSSMRAAALASAALMLAACGQTASSPSGAGESSTPTSGQASSSASPSGAKLPGIREFGLNDEEFAQHIEKSQALIASCMADAGFEYVPVNVQTVEAAQARVRQDPGLTRKEYKERYGLAVTTRFDDPVRDIGLGPENLRIIASLPEASRVAYNRTLFGRNTHANFVFALDEEDFSKTGGCTRKAVAQVFTPDQVKGTFVNPKDVLVDSDKQFIAARRAWSKCMRAAGYDYLEDQDEIIEDFEERLDELLDGDEPQSLTGARAEELKALQQEEIAVALADLDCQIKYTDNVEEEVEIKVYGRPLDTR
jgi:hypothetical protein